MRVKIKEVRESKGMTQDCLAKKLAMSRPYLAQIEGETRNLTAKKQKQIADALGVDARELVDFSAPDREDEKLILNWFRGLSPAQRAEWLKMNKILLSEK